MNLVRSEHVIGALGTLAELGPMPIVGITVIAQLLVTCKWASVDGKAMTISITDAGQKMWERASE